MKAIFVAIALVLLLVGSVAAARYLIVAPRDPSALNNAAYTAHEEGQLELAEALYLSAINLDPSYELGRYNLALLYFEEEKYDKADEQFVWLLDNAEDKAAYHYDYAVNYVARFRSKGEASVEDFNHAIAHYEWADHLEPGYAHARANADALTKIRDRFFGKI